MSQKTGHGEAEWATGSSGAYLVWKLESRRRSAVASAAFCIAEAGSTALYRVGPRRRILSPRRATRQGSEQAEPTVAQSGKPPLTGERKAGSPVAESPGTRRSVGKHKETGETLRPTDSDIYLAESLG